MGGLFAQSTNGYGHLDHRHCGRLRTRGTDQIVSSGSCSGLSECRAGLAEWPRSLSKLEVRLSLFSTVSRCNDADGEITPETGEHFLAISRRCLFSCRT